MYGFFRKYLLFLCYRIMLLLKYGFELSNSLFIIFLLQSILENCVAKFSLYSRNCIFRTSDASSDNWPIGNITRDITFAPCIKTLCTISDIEYHPYSSGYIFTVSCAKILYLSTSKDTPLNTTSRIALNSNQYWRQWFGKMNPDLQRIFVMYFRHWCSRILHLRCLLKVPFSP